MPVYEYECQDCGVFEAFAPMSAFKDPCNCPVCGATSSRALTIPNYSTMSTGNYVAHETNERSADSPKRSKQHGPGCSCCSGGLRPNRKTLHRPDGSKSFPASRPWMISH